MEVNSPSLSQALFDDFDEGPERLATDFQPEHQPSGRQAALKKGMKPEEIERIHVFLFVKRVVLHVQSV